MSVYVVYHDTENADLQRIPFADGNNPFDRFYDEWLSTSRQSTLNQAVAERGWCLFIVSLGKPKKYFLWAYFQFFPSAETKTVSGEGWMLNPPQKLEGSDFKKFKDTECRQFEMGLQNVTESPFAASLISVAGEFHKPQVTRETLRFCMELRSLTKAGGELEEDARELEQYVRKILSRKTGPSKDKSNPPKEKPSSPKVKTSPATSKTSTPKIKISTSRVKSSSPKAKARSPKVKISPPKAKTGKPKPTVARTARGKKPVGKSLARKRK